MVKATQGQIFEGYGSKKRPNLELLLLLLFPKLFLDLISKVYCSQICLCLYILSPSSYNVNLVIVEIAIKRLRKIIELFFHDYKQIYHGDKIQTLNSKMCFVDFFKASLC